jgi:hypothetical protein
MSSTTIRAARSAGRAAQRRGIGCGRAAAIATMALSAISAEHDLHFTRTL